MRTKTIALFGSFYSVLLAAGLALSYAVLVAGGLESANQGVTKNVAFAVNLLTFFAAVSLAISRRMHGTFGETPGPAAFRQILSDGRAHLAVGIAVVAVSIDFCAYLAPSWFFTGEMRVPSLLRLALMAAAYGVLAWMAISDRSARGKHVVGG